MKPNFALSLSFDGIGLLHRTGASQWHLVGEVSLDSADLTMELAALREKAGSLEPSGVSSKLVIPDSQIRYLDLAASDAPDADHEATAMRALDGATPYALDDLAFDWNVVDGRLRVAAVARETLQEAENFAVEHRFNPVSFVARPEATNFGTEPFFGETSEAGARVVRDQDPIEIAGAASLPEPQPPDGATEGPVDQETTAAMPTPDPEDKAGAASSAPALTAARSAQDAPETGAPHLSGAARDTPDRAASKGGQGAVANPAPAAASLAPRGDGPTVADATGQPRPEAPTPRRRPAQGAGSGKGSSPRRKKDGPGNTATVKGAGAASAEDEADRLTIFGARATQRGQRGKPRFLGLIMTALLLLVLAGVAAWATMFPDSDLARLVRWSEPQVAVTPQSPDAIMSDPVPVDPGQAGDDPAPQVAIAPPPETSDATDTEEAPEPPARSGPLTPDEARARYAETGIWQIPPEAPVQPDAGSLDEFYLTSIDEDVSVGDAVALPDMPARRRDTRPDTPAAPAPPGTTFELDERGLVAATPDGSLTPDGVLVRAGPPPVRPPDTPPRVVPVPGLSLTPEAAAELERISEIRPRTRPEDLVERQERGALGGRSRTELASLRPQTRPAAVQRAAMSPAPDTDAVDAALAEAAESPGPDEAAWAEAVTASLKPRQRPGDFQSIVRREAAQPRAAAPRIPSSASVAQRATSRNAINLRQVNLIGVYGSPSNRRALVRLSNGRYRKVEVGDSIDGGRVSAIGDSELRYTKRGRAVVLRMPRG